MDEDDGGDTDEAGAVDEVENHIAVDDLQVIEGAEAGDRGEYQCEVPTMMMMMMVVVYQYAMQSIFQPQEEEKLFWLFFLGVNWPSGPR